MIENPDVICRCDDPAWQHKPDDADGTPGPCAAPGCDCDQFITTREWNRQQREKERRHG